MNNYGITVDNLHSSLPAVLRNDKNLDSLAHSIARVLASNNEDIELIKIYSQIDSMPERLLDILARDFKVSWWTQEMDVENKRNTLKTSWFVHRKLGTKGAVKKALSSVYENSDVSEWYEYDGEPFHFRILIDAEYENTNIEKYNAVIKQVAFYKNVRSYLDAVEYVNKGVTITQTVEAYAEGFATRDVCTTANAV